MWWVPAVGAAAAWGVWGAMSSTASKHGNALGVFAVAVFVEAVVALPLIGRASRSLSWWVVGAGLSGALAYGLFFVALKRGPASSVVAVTSLYPAVTAVIAVALIGEAMTVRKMFGVGLAVVAAAVIGG